MSKTQTPKRCERCGAELKQYGIERLCPACMIADGLETLAGTIKASPQSTAEDVSPPLVASGERIGRYKILEQLGEGGFGVVYLADQEHPVRRKVALKVIKLGMDTRQVVARFEAERQALALMDHPNIAKVLDGGATDTGRPYFVMELVRGVRITEYCDQHNLATRERLGLFNQVCHAIQHAHQKGIIHRDIKPSNILVSLQDGQPVPKVIDFGIAKATDQRLTEKTLHTGLHQFIGTPAYMSPEQAEMTALDIDTRSDIYSLGVLLYELLTGKTPFEAKRLIEAGLNEIRRIIREEDPPRPSTRLSSLAAGEQTTVARRRQLEPPRLIHLMQGDLDWIVMKALEKDRTRRYDTANGLAMDLERHLKNEPVLACPPTVGYRFQKLVRRNQLAVAAVSAVVAALMVGLGIAAWQYFEKSKAYNRAVAAEKQAKSEASRSQQVALFLKEMLRSAGPSVARGRDATVLREMLDKTAQRVGKDLTNQPEIRADLWFTLGNTYADVGDYPRAIPMMQQAVDDYRSALGNENIQLALALGGLGKCQSFAQNVSAGRSNSQLGLEIARRCGDPDTLAACLENLARSFVAWGEGSPEAVPLLREAVALRRQRGNNPAALANALSRLAGSFVDDADSAESEALAREALAIHRQQFEPDHPAVAGDVFMLGQMLKKRGKLEEAESVLRETLELYRKIHDKNHPYQSVVRRILAETLVLRDKQLEAEQLLREGLALDRERPENPNLVGSIKEFADLLAKVGKPAEAEQLYREHLALLRKPGGQKGQHLTWHILNFTEFLVQQGRFAEAEQIYREHLELLRKPGGQADPDLTWHTLNFTEFLVQQGKFAEAEQIFREHLALLRKPGGQADPDLAWHTMTLAKFLIPQGKFAEAEQLYRESLRMERKIHGPESLELTGPMRGLADVCAKQNRLAEAEQLFREASALRDRFQAGGHPDFAWLDYNLASVLRDEGKLTEAEAKFREALATMRKVPAPEAPALPNTLATLADLLGDQGRWSEAENLQRESAGIARTRSLSKDRDKLLQWSLRGLGQALKRQGKLGEAQAAYREALEHSRKCWPEDPARWEANLADLVDMLRRQGNDGEAEILFRDFLASAGGDLSQSAELLLARADFFARRQRSPEAVADVSKALELAPTNHELYRALAPLLVANGDLERYRQLCLQIVERFAGTTDPIVAERMVKACLIVPSTEIALEPLRKMADDAITPAQDAGHLAWAALSKALVDLRAGNHAAATDWAGKSLAPANTVDDPRFVMAYAVLAQAQFRLNRSGEAGVALDKGREILKAKMPKPQSGDLGNDWRDWIIAQALMRETESLLEWNDPKGPGRAKTNPWPPL